MIRKTDHSQEIDAGGECLDIDLVRVEFQLQLVFQESADSGNEVFQMSFVFGHDHEIIGVADVVFLFHFVLHELVEPVHINVDEQLRSEIAEGKTDILSVF